MKTIFCLLFIFAAFLQLHAQKADSAAAKIMEANLKVIEDCLSKKEPSLQKISDAVYFFTDLTGISSESNGSYYGQFKPTNNDLKAWTSWYALNKEYLIWDQELKAIILYKKVKPAIVKGDH